MGTYKIMTKTDKAKSTGIKNWPKDDRPREKLLKFGEHTLTNAELLAILLRSGVKGSSAVDLGRKIIAKFKTFRNLSHTDISQWKEFKGLGPAKIAQIKDQDTKRLEEEVYTSYKLTICKQCRDIFNQRIKNKEFV